MKKRDILCDMGLEDAIIFESPDYDEAIVGVTEDDRVVYAFDLMVEHLKNKCEINSDEAIEFINYNTIRALPYMGDQAPIIMYRIPE